MNRRRTGRATGPGWVPLLALALCLGPGCGKETIGWLPDAGGVPDAPAADAGPQWPDLGPLDGGAKPGCTKNAQCNGGFCVGGTCCPTKERVCGQSCCQPAELCFANACVTPGNLCYSTADCPVGQYCEPAVGSGSSATDGGVKVPDGQVCLKATPKVGRCLKLPPRCGVTDAGAPGKDGGCLPACEYRPPTVPKLSAKQKWSWGPSAREYKNSIDVWSTPTVARIYDTNCDGRVNELDPPNVVFVSGNVKNTCCSCSNDKVSTCLTGVLRLLDGETGQEIWSLRKASSSSVGFSGVSLALGDVDKDGRVEILAATGEGKVVQIGPTGQVEKTSDKAIPQRSASTFGWGGGLALADMDRDGYPEVAYGATVFVTRHNPIRRLWVGDKGIGGGDAWALSTFVDLDGAPNGHLELLAGNTAYKSDGSRLWYRSDLPDGLVGVGDLDKDGKPEVVMVAQRKIWVLEGATGQTELGPLQLIGSTKERGGPPTVADFDGDKRAEIGIALRQYYYVIKPDYAQKTLKELWKTPNHDLSSSVTGSTVFDFEGDGRAEVIYNDECFLWVYDGRTGAVRFATPTTSFTGTEASLVADVDGDGRAEMVMISNGADPTNWGCTKSPWNKPDPVLGRPAWVPPAGQSAYRGITIWEDAANAWVGTRTLWNQHTYHVSNICDSRDSACSPPNFYGLIPKKEKKNWLVPWLNNFRQNVQDKGLFDAPDPTVTLKVECTKPVVLRAYVRNYGLALLPAGVEVGFYVQRSGVNLVLLGKGKTASPLFPGQVAEVAYTTQASQNVGQSDVYQAKILIDPKNPTFHECRPGNNTSPLSKANCLQ